jgi:hypothetical protein
MARTMAEPYCPKPPPRHGTPPHRLVRCVAVLHLALVIAMTCCFRCRQCCMWKVELPNGNPHTCRPDLGGHLVRASHLFETQSPDRSLVLRTPYSGPNVQRETCGRTSGSTPSSYARLATRQPCLCLRAPQAMVPAPHACFVEDVQQAIELTRRHARTPDSLISRPRGQRGESIVLRRRPLSARKESEKEGPLDSNIKSPGTTSSTHNTSSVTSLSLAGYLPDPVPNPPRTTLTARLTGIAGGHPGTRCRNRGGRTTPTHPVCR